MMRFSTVLSVVETWSGRDQHSRDEPACSLSVAYSWQLAQSESQDVWELLDVTVKTCNGFCARKAAGSAVESFSNVSRLVIFASELENNRSDRHSFSRMMLSTAV